MGKILLSLQHEASLHCCFRYCMLWLSQCVLFIRMSLVYTVLYYIVCYGCPNVSCSSDCPSVSSAVQIILNNHKALNVKNIIILSARG